MRGTGLRALATAACCTVALVASPATSSAGSQTFSPAYKSELQHSLKAIVGAPGGPPAVSVLIDRGRRTEFIAAGMATPELPPAPGLYLRIASVSKAFNAYLAVRLAQGGALSLRGTVGESIPGVLPAAEAVTLRQLLQHTSGIADYIRAPAFLEQFVADPTVYFSPRQLTDFVRDDPLRFAPGSRYHYSDTDNIAAALIEQEASGLSYERLLRTRVFEPLGMGGSSLPRTPELPEPFMRGYEVEQGKDPEDISEAINPAGAWASGGIVSTPVDLARFAAAYVPAMLRVSRGLDSAFRPGSSSPPGPGRNSAGLGIFRYRLGCGTVYGHTGSFPGYRLLLAARGDGQRSVVFAVNAQIVPGQGSPKVAAAITRAQAQAICRALA